MKKIYRLICLILLLFVSSNFFIVNQVWAKDKVEKVYLGGMPAGFALYTRGAQIVGVCDVVTEKGIVSPAKKSDLVVGDIILNIDDYEINTAKDVELAIKNDSEKIIVIKRNNQIIVDNIKPVKDLNGINRLGVLIRDEINGIGTITYIKGDRFASLGHPVVDEKGEIISITGGTAYHCKITDYIRGEKGKAGELRGIFLRNKTLANLDKNLNVGVYGNVDLSFENKNLKEISVGEAKMGDAFIYTTIKGDKSEKFSISIVKIENQSNNKNFVIKITDDKLIEKTGGIVQGMSGSPIVQNGYLVGAVTHVFINDPTRGFGISIQNMINN